MAAMKWWGWGDEAVEFSHEDKPDLAPFIAQAIGVDVGKKVGAPVRFDDLEIPAPNLADSLRGALEQAVTAHFVSIDPLDRVVHARGKSLRDLIRQRSGDLGRVPDVVVRPGNEDEVTATLQAALGAEAVLIPFGGGSSISGSLEASAGEKRPVISMDLERLNRVK
jgi:alkyldihydroxyacetonephosphate synthase